MAVSRVLARFKRNIANPIMRMFAGRLPPFAIVTHRGRITGRLYSTPAWAFRTDEGLLFAILYGSSSDWVKNISAYGSAEVKRLGTTLEYGAPRVASADESLAFLPTPFRFLFRLVRVRNFLHLKLAPDAGSFTRPLLTNGGNQSPT